MSRANRRVRRRVRSSRSGKAANYVDVRIGIEHASEHLRADPSALEAVCYFVVVYVCCIPVDIAFHGTDLCCPQVMIQVGRHIERSAIR